MFDELIRHFVASRLAGLLGVPGGGLHPGNVLLHHPMPPVRHPVPVLHGGGLQGPPEDGLAPLVLPVLHGGGLQLPPEGGAQGMDFGSPGDILAALRAALGSQGFAPGTFHHTPDYGY